MITTNISDRDSFVATFGKDVFRSDISALRPLAATRIAGVLIAACTLVATATLFALNPWGAGSSSTQDSMSAKTDRISASSMPSVCDGQTWGAYSADCAAALRGLSSVPTVSFRTVELPAGDNTTVLARIPANG